MNQIVKRTLCLLLCLLLAAGAGGCAAFPDDASGFSDDTSVLDAGSPFKRYFGLLTDTEKIAYNAVLSAIHAFPERIEVPVLTQDELETMYTALLYDNPELFFLSGKTVIRQVKKHAFLYPEYRIGMADYDAMYRKCGEIASSVTDEAFGEETAFDRERIVHDRLAAICRYSDDETNMFKSTIYGALCGGEAACEGYAKSVKYLLDLLGIPCFVVIGTSTPPGSREQSHMWNVVQLDGDWYHFDLTWDDPVLEKGGDLIRYSYFNVTDETLRKTHSGFDTGVVCSATRNNFFVHEDLLFPRFGDAESRRAAIFAARTINAGSSGFQLRFVSEDAYAAAQKSLFEEGAVYTLLKRIEALTQQTFQTDRVTYFTTDDDFTVEIILT